MSNTTLPTTQDSTPGSVTAPSGSSTPNYGSSTSGVLPSSRRKKKNTKQDMLQQFIYDTSSLQDRLHQTANSLPQGDLRAASGNSIATRFTKSA